MGDFPSTIQLEVKFVLPIDLPGHLSNIVPITRLLYPYPRAPIPSLNPKLGKQDITQYLAALSLLGTAFISCTDLPYKLTKVF